MQETEEKSTTAQALGAHRRELIEEGFSEGEAFEVVMQTVRNGDNGNLGITVEGTPTA